LFAILQKVVSSNNYTVTAGSTVITLSAGYFSTLTDSTHNFRAAFSNGTLICANSEQRFRYCATNKRTKCWRFGNLYGNLFVADFVAWCLFVFPYKRMCTSK